MIEMDGRDFIIIAMPQENKLLLQLIWLLKISFISILGNVTIRMVSKTMSLKSLCKYVLIIFLKMYNAMYQKFMNVYTMSMYTHIYSYLPVSCMC